MIFADALPSIVAETAQDLDPQAAAFLEQTELSTASMVAGLLNSSDDCIKVINRDGLLELMNCSGQHAMEIDDFELVRGKPWVSFWPDAARAQVEDSVVQGLDGKLSRFEAFCPTAKGTPRWWEVTVAPVTSAGGEVSALISTSRDVTERVRRTQEIETLALELRHRLRNSYAISAAILRASARGRAEVAEFTSEVATRLLHLSAVQSGLLDFDEQIPLNVLVERILSIDSESARAFEFSALPAVTLGPATAKALALSLGELASNSLKYGALQSGGGISLFFSLSDDGLKVDWNERNGNDHEQIDHNHSSTGQGKVLIERILSAVGGQIWSGPTPDGYRADIAIARWQT